MIVLDEFDHALDKLLAALASEGGVGETARAEPSANRDENCKGGLLVPQAGQECEIGGVIRMARNHAAVLDVGECEVDAGDGMGIDLAGLQERVLGEDVGNDEVGLRRRSGTRATVVRARTQRRKEWITTSGLAH